MKKAIAFVMSFMLVLNVLAFTAPPPEIGEEENSLVFADLADVEVMPVGIAYAAREVDIGMELTYVIDRAVCTADTMEMVAYGHEIGAIEADEIANLLAETEFVFYDNPFGQRADKKWVRFGTGKA